MDGDLSVGAVTAAGLAVSGTGGVAIPAGTDAQRPASPAPGTLRFNTEQGQFEGYHGSDEGWKVLGAVAPKIVVDGLELWLDAGDAASYPGSGGNWIDLSGKGNDATMWGTVNFQAGTNGGAFSLDGGAFTLEGWESYHAAAEVTFEVWARHRSHRSTNTGILTNYWSGAGKANWMWNQDRGYHINGMKGSSNSDNRPNFLHNSWYRFAVVGRADQGYVFYINNEKVYTHAYTGNLAGSAGSLGIGAREDKAEPCDALFAVARVYTRALSAAELQENYEAEKARFP